MRDNHVDREPSFAQLWYFKVMKDTPSFAEPKANILQMGLREGMKVADLGCGSGHYTFLASRIVGPMGRVYAVDIQEDHLSRLRGEALERGIRNIETIWGNVEKAGGTMLKDHTLDAVILSNALFQLEKKEQAIAEIKRILKPGGTLLVVDWAGPYNGLGPRAEFIVPEQKAEELFIMGGFHKVKSFRGGPHHYSLVCAAP